MIQNFETVNNVRKYKSDWSTFLYESRIEDFQRIHSEFVYVSTIHKAKGKEFDNVFLMLKNPDSHNDAFKRLFYVAVTRAKDKLFIHYQGNYLHSFKANKLLYHNDQTIYHEPDLITLSLGLRDVQLGYFEFIQTRIEHLYSGFQLMISHEGLKNDRDQLILKFSKHFNAALLNYQERGYKLQQAYVYQIVYWFNESKNQESKVILPLLILKKCKNS